MSQFDSGELGDRRPADARARLDWSTPTNLPPGTYTYFCRIHPFMRGAFRGGRLSVPDTSRGRRVSRTGKIVVGVVGALVVVGVGAWWFVFRDTAAPKARVDAVAANRAAGAESRCLTGRNVDRQGRGLGLRGIPHPGAVRGRHREADCDRAHAEGEGHDERLGPHGRVRADRRRSHRAHERPGSTRLAIRERGLETGRFPETTFTLTAPITLPSTPVKGTSYRVTATGDLALHGVTRSVQVALEAKWNGSTIAVAGSAPIVLGDYGMASIKIPGFIETDDRGTLELQLLFVPA